MLITKKRALEDRITKPEIDNLVGDIKKFNMHATLSAVGSIYGIANLIEGDYSAGALGFLATGVCAYLASRVQYRQKELDAALSKHFGL